MKYIFFDIDGTLVYAKDGKECIPESTIKTIKALQEKGHITAIASGRSLTTVKPIAQRLGIHHAVSDGGYGVMMNDQLVYREPLEKELVLKLCDELLAKKIPFAFMIDQSHQLYANSLMLSGQSQFGFENFPIVLDETFDYRQHGAFKVFLGLHRGDEDLLETIDAHKIMRYVDDCIAFEPDDKYKGVKELVKRHKGNIKDVIFFGDGQNDIAMFQEVPFSIAMGNAIDELKSLAYYITKNVDEDGIEHACKHFNLID